MLFQNLSRIAPAAAALAFLTAAAPSYAQNQKDAPTQDMPAATQPSDTGQTGAAPSQTPQTPDQALLQAATSGDFIAAKAALDQGADVDTRDDTGRTPLMRAVFFGFPDVVNVLVDHKADINAKDNTGTTPLGYAVNNKFALARATPQTQASTTGEQPSASARSGASTSPVASDATSNSTTSTNAQSTTASKPHSHHSNFLSSVLSVASMAAPMLAGPAGLLSMGGMGGMGAMGGMGMVSGMMSMFGGHGFGGMGGIPGMAAIMPGMGMTAGMSMIPGMGRMSGMGKMPNMPGIDPQAMTEMQKAAMNPDFQKAMMGLQSQAAGGKEFAMQLLPQYEAIMQKYAPHMAAMIAKNPMMTGAMSQGAGQLAQGDNEQTYTVLVQALLDQGAAVDAKDQQGETPLICASKLGSTEVVKILLSKGANVSAQDAQGKTALAYAKAGNYAEIADLLQKMGAKE